MNRALVLSVMSSIVAAMSAPGEMFPFVLPWDDAAPSVIDLSSWNERPAGKHGFVAAKEDGHLYAGDKRIRFFGVNMCFGGNFPDKAAAPKIAARMAKFGINCVRFHHMDMQNAPGGIFAADGKTLDAGQLDRLDYFVAQLKEHGIYTNLNLHVSRTHPDRPRAEKRGNPSYDKGIDNFSAGMIELQKEFARALLDRVNPYTMTRYADEPAVAFVEINNENALLFEWMTGGLDGAAAPYRAELSQLWTTWLRAKYGSDEKVAEAWATGAKPKGGEMLKNGNFAEGMAGWHFETHDGAQAKSRIANGAIEVTVAKAAKENWHVQFFRTGIELRGGEGYTLTFRGRSDVPRRVTATASQAHDPWRVFGSKSVELTPEWQTFSFRFTAGEDDKNSRVGISGLGADVGRYEFTDFSLTPSGRDGSVPRDESGAIRAFTKDDVDGRTLTAQQDWHRFLWQTEEAYWTGMKRFLREEIKTRSLIIGTQLGWSPFPIQAQMDVIDSHAYWQHPHFPRRQWDMNDWTVKNLPMAGAAGGGTLAALALQRVAGKPYVCTEYNHSAPNTFSSEAFPLVCAFAALQDWDGVFAFAYSHRGNDWDRRMIPSFFDIDQHPTKMATLPGAIALFRRGDVQPGKAISIGATTLDGAIEQARRSGPRLSAQHFGVKWQEAFLRRVAVQVDDGETMDARPAPKQPALESDTGELMWDTARRVVTINAARSKGVIGELTGGPFQLGEVKIEAEPTGSKWAVIQVTAMDGKDLKSAKKVVVTATAAAENTDMKWRDEEKTSVGRDWGKPPSVVEGVSARVHLPKRGGAKAWALDEQGQRRDKVPLRGGVLELSPEHRTLWYEVEYGGD